MLICLLHASFWSTSNMLGHSQHVVACNSMRWICVVQWDAENFFLSIMSTPYTFSKRYWYAPFHGINVKNSNSGNMLTSLLHAACCWTCHLLKHLQRVVICKNRRWFFAVQWDAERFSVWITSTLFKFSRRYWGAPFDGINVKTSNKGNMPTRFVRQ